MIATKMFLPSRTPPFTAAAAARSFLQNLPRFAAASSHPTRVRYGAAGVRGFRSLENGAGRSSTVTQAQTQTHTRMQSWLELQQQRLQQQRWRLYSTYRRFDGRGGGGWGSPGGSGGGGGGGWGNNGRYYWLYQYRYLIAGGAGGIGTFYIWNLEVVDVSGRRRFNCVPAEQELKFGKQTYRQILQEYRGRILPPSHPYTRFVDGVMRRLVPFAEVEGMATDWEVHVIKDDSMMNAFVLPGGKVFVFTGILPITQDEDGMAAVLGHEIAHVVAHHPAERMSSSILAVVAVAATSFLFDVSGNISSLIFNLAFGLPNSRTQEAEADQIGLGMMAKACYNPQAAVKLWSRMQKAEKGAPPQFLSTHPSSSSRMERIGGWLPDAEQAYADSGCGETTRYARDFGRAFDNYVW